MSDRAEELAKQLLEKTEGGKLHWIPVYGEPTESYRTNLEDGFSFSIKRKADGDDKVISFILTGPQGTLLSKVVDNMLAGPVRFSGQEPGVVAFPKVKQFRLFSDLFYAARGSAAVEDQTMEKVQQLLERLG